MQGSWSWGSAESPPLRFPRQGSTRNSSPGEAKEQRKTSRIVQGQFTANHKTAPFTLFSGTDHAVDCRHVTGIRVDVDGVDRDLGLRNQLLVVVGLQIPDVNHAALVSDNQLRLENTQDASFMDSTGLQANTLNSIKIRIKTNMNPWLLKLTRLHQLISVVPPGWGAGTHS